jgi:hypothetical protein
LKALRGYVLRNTVRTGRTFPISEKMPFLPLDDSAIPDSRPEYTLPACVINLDIFVI